MSAPSIVLAYPSPILRQQLDDAEELNDALRSIVLQRAEAQRGVGKSNVGGWHSETDFFDWPHPQARELLSVVARATKSIMAAATGRESVKGELDAWGWANVLYRGGYNVPHIHSDAMWSGVYYVDVGEEAAPGSPSGIIEFMDPRTGVDMIKIPGMPFTGRVQVAPRSATVLMFPSWLYHFVHPYQGERPRISIAFNVRIVNTDLPEGLFGGGIQYPLGPGAIER